MSASRIRRVGLLTGGGDCPGLNAVIRAVTTTALRAELEVMGIRDGYLGLIDDRVQPLAGADVEDILARGGTILGTSNKSNPSRYAVGRDANGQPIFENVVGRCLATIERHGMDALLLVGGDGTMAGSAAIIRAGVNCIGLPKTVDNDLEGTDISFGFLTAVSIATEALDRVSTTAASHHRAIVVEVMGRNAGWIALFAATAAGCPVVLMPEIPFDIESVCRAIEARRARGRTYSVVCVAEGAVPRGGTQVISRIDPASPEPIRLGGIAQQVAGQIEARTGIESRYVVLGHVQRGGAPEPPDRILGTQLGHRAVDALLGGLRNRLVGRDGFREIDTDILSIIGKQRHVPLRHPVLDAARGMGVCFGD